MGREQDYPSVFQKKTCWSALTGLSIATIVALVIALACGVIALFAALEQVLLPVIVAGVSAYLFNPPVEYLQRYLHRLNLRLRRTRRREVPPTEGEHRPLCAERIARLRGKVRARRKRERTGAVLAVLSGAAAAFGIICATIVPPLAEQAGRLFEQRDELIAKAVQTGRDFLRDSTAAQHAIDMLCEGMQDDGAGGESTVRTEPSAGNYEEKLLLLAKRNSSRLTHACMRWLTKGKEALFGILGSLVGMVLIPVFLFYFLLLKDKIASDWHRLLPLRSSRFRDELVETLREINDCIISFVRGQMFVSIIDGALLGLALYIMGLPYAAVIGVVAALLGIIPYIGMIVTCIPAVLIAVVTWHDTGHPAAVVIIFLVVSQLDGWIIQPRLLGSRLRMHDLTIMFSVLFWSYVLGGIVGALLAVPLTASLKVLYSRYVWSRFISCDTPQEETASPQPSPAAPHGE